MQNNQLNLLTENALPAETITLREAEAELAEANARIASSGKDAEKVRQEQARAMAKVTMARMHGGR